MHWQLISVFACGRFRPFVFANARGNQLESLHLGSNCLVHKFVGFATSKSTVRIQMQLIEGNFSELRKGTRNGSVVEDQEPSSEDKNRDFRVYQLGQIFDG